MFETLKEVFLVNAYWLSLPLAGYGLILILIDTKSTPRIIADNLARFRMLRLFEAFPLSFAFMTTILGSVAVAGYLIHASVWIVAAVYVLLCAAGLSYLVFLVARNIFKEVDIDIFSFRREVLLVRMVVAGLGLLIFLDYLASLYVRAYAPVSADTYVHLSRIVSILSQGLTMESGYFKDIAEGGYHMNIMYALYAVPAYLFHLSASTVWEFSFGFFRVLQWCSIFLLARHVFTYWIRTRVNTVLLASLVSIFAISYYSPLFYIALYPNQISNVWLILFVVIMSRYEMGQRHARIPALSVAILLTFTHSAYALMAAAWLVFVLIIKFALKKYQPFSKKVVATYGALSAVLMIGPLITAALPNRLQGAGSQVGAFPTLSIGPLSIKEPPQIFTPLTLNTLFVLLGMLGLAFLMYKVWNQRRQFPLIVALVLFFPLIAYFPPAFTFLRNIFPLWVIDRFTAMNVLRFLSVPLGLAALVYLGIWFMQRRRSASELHVRTLSLLLCVVTLMVSLYFVLPPRLTFAQYKHENAHYYAFMDRIYADFGGVLNDEQLVVANTGDSYLIGSVLPIDVIAIEDGHTTPTADIADRVKCQRRLLSSLVWEDLRAVNASFVVLPKYDKTYHGLKQMADQKEYLRIVAQNQDFWVYRFSPDSKYRNSDSKPYEPCVRYQVVEQS